MDKEKWLRMIDEYLLESDNIDKEWVESLSYYRQLLKKELDVQSLKIDCEMPVFKPENVIIQHGASVFIRNDKIFVNGKVIPPLPSRDGDFRITSNTAIINNKVFADGYEFKDGKWKRTLRALWHLLF